MRTHCNFMQLLLGNLLALCVLAGTIGFLGLGPESALAAPIPNAVMWFDAQDLDGDGNFGNNQANSTPVFTWVDKASGVQGQQNLVQNNILPYQPTYLTNVQNGQAAVQFDGTNDMMSAASLSLGSFSVFVQLRATATGTNRLVMEQSNDLNSSGNGFYWADTVGHTFQSRRASTTSGKNVTAPTPTTWALNPTLLTATQIYDGTHAGHLMYINGVLSTTTSPAPGNPGTATATNTFNLGARYGTGTPIAPFNGQIAEVLIYNSKLNTFQQRVVENYLSAKYASTLAANNLYDGDLNGNGDYDSDVFGIGRASNGDLLSTDSFDTGLTLTESGSTLDPNDSLLAGHNGSAATFLNNTLNRVWYLDKRGSFDATITFNADKLGFIPSADHTYLLLYKGTLNGTFAALPNTAIVSGNDISFLLTNSQLATGYYTLQDLPPAPEPGSFALLGLGTLLLARSRRRRQA